ncbi:hypothetical protein AAON49_13510 [Pseudotenacibaculum sp. MALMAid0570]|uniref:hypothetical protein n=1 Tax=Pseudotenacibaculum sp. MALMAid0570 TaxID=3143938 RepID=UPI0032DEFBB8
MTHQDFNHIYYKFTGNKRGIKPSDSLKTTGEELKDFLEFAIDSFDLNKKETP